MSVTRHFPPRLTRRHLERQGRIEWHDHDRHQLVYPMNGVDSVITDAGTWVVPPFRAIWLPAGFPHAHVAHGVVELCSVLLPTGPSQFRSDRPTLVAVTPLVRELLLALTGTPPLAPEQQSRIETVVVYQLEPVDRGAPYLLPESDDDRLRTITEILRADPTDSRTLAELGQTVGASERTLSRLFRAETGMSFPQWRAQLRLQVALIELQSGASISSVAHRCGYSTPSAFIANFGHAFGTTPGTFRRLNTWDTYMRSSS